ncbi:MAG: hypothetical protein QXG12_07330 [Thermoproteota archaeon]
MKNNRGKLIPILLRFYESKRTGASASFTIEPKQVREVREYCRTGFWLYALVEQGSKITARIKLKSGAEMEKVIEATKAGMVTRDGSFIPLPPDSGLFKRLFEESLEDDSRKRGA